MPGKSKIEWTDCSWNPTTGCSQVSPGCAHCYAIRQAGRIEAMQPENAAYKGLTVIQSNGVRNWTGKVRCHEDRLDKPLRWKKPRRIFVDSMSDLFHEDVPFEFIHKVFAVMALCPRHTFQVLTKRPERMAQYFNSEPNIGADGRTYTTSWHRVYARLCEYPTDQIMASVRGKGGVVCPGWPLPNVWLGTSVENQQTANERIPHLLKCPAAVRFLSLEPLLGPVKLWEWNEWDDKLEGVAIVTDGGMQPSTPHGPAEYWETNNPGIDWCIVGGESGAQSRPFNIEWARSLRDQCKLVGVLAFIKQLGSVPCMDYYTDDEDAREAALESDGRVFEPASDRSGRYREWHEHDRWQPSPGTLLSLRLRHRKGADMDEWPEDLRIREIPEGAVK